MDRFQYLWLLAACLVVTAPLELVFGARVWRRPRHLARALLVPFVAFAAWDALAVARRHWSWNPRYVTGARVWRLPVEELAFFLVIPVCALLTYDAFSRHFRGERAPVWERLARARATRRR